MSGEFDHIRGNRGAARYEAEEYLPGGVRWLARHSGCQRATGGDDPVGDYFDNVGARLVDVVATYAHRQGEVFDQTSVRAATGHLIGSGHFSEVLAGWAKVEAQAILDATVDDIRTTTTPIELQDYRPGAFPVISVTKIDDLRIDDVTITMAGMTAAGGESLRVLAKTIKLATSRELLANDDRQAIAAMYRAFGAQVGRRLGRDYAGLLEANANLTDGVALFASAEGNDLASAGVDAAAIGAMMAALRDRTTPDGEHTNAAPAALVVPTANEAAARAVVAAMFHPDDPARLRVIALPWLGGSYFYLCADPVAAPSVALGSLEGSNGALVTFHPSAKSPPSGRNVDGSSRRVAFEGAAVDARIAYGLAAVDRSIVRNTTA